MVTDLLKVHFGRFFFTHIFAVYLIVFALHYDVTCQLKHINVSDLRFFVIVPNCVSIC